MIVKISPTTLHLILLLETIQGFFQSSISLPSSAICKNPKTPAIRTHGHVLQLSNRPKSSQIRQGFQQHGGDINPAYCSLSYDEIIQLIKKRSKARRARNFELADEILKQLNDNRVYLNDKEKLWRADGDTFDVVRYQEISSYKKSSQSRPISSREEDYINQKLRERTMAKLVKDYDTADDILDELRFIKNVVVDDNSMTWKVTEPFKTEYTYGGRRLSNIPDEVVQKIERLVRKRSEAKDKKDFVMADNILDELEDVHGVRVDDSKKAWFFLPKFGEDLNAERKSRGGGGG